MFSYGIVTLTNMLIQAITYAVILFLKRPLWEKKMIPFTAGNRFSLLQRPRSQDISGIPTQNSNIHESVENDSHLFSPKRKLNFGRKGNLVLEENRHTSKLLGNNGDTKGRSTKDKNMFFKSKVY